MIKKLFFICAGSFLLLALPGMVLADYPNTCGSASSIGTVPLYTSTISRADAISPAGDYDWFRVYVPANRRLIVYTTGSTDTYGYLYSDSCGSLQSNDNNGSSINFRIEQSVTTAGYYRIGVKHHSSAGTGSYTLYVTSRPDDYPNSCSSAAYLGTVPLGSNFTRSAAINYSGDYDWFRVYVPANRKLIAYTTGSTDTYGYLYSDSCGSLQSNDDYGSSINFRIERNVATAGYYRIGVRHYSTGTGSYTLYVTSTAATADDYPNSCSSAAYLGTVPLGSNLTRSAAINYSGDMDSFRVYVPAGRKLIVYTTGSTDTYGYLYSDSCGLLQYNDDYGSSINFRIEWNVTTAGYYRILVRHYSTGTGSYTLYVTSTVAAADDYPSTCGSAYNIGAVPSWPNYISYSATISYPGDMDWFRVYVPAGKVLFVYTTGSTDTYGYLYSDGCVLIAQNDDWGTDSNFHFEQHISTAGYFRIGVRHYNSSSGTGSYTLIMYMSFN